MRMSPLYICLPFVAILGSITPAIAGMAPAEATALLAKTLVIDKRCNVLSSEARQELQDFVARAEIALAEMQSVQVARTALAKGRASGKIGECGPELAKRVNDVLEEARRGAGADNQAPIKLDVAAEPPDQVVTEPKQDVAVLAAAAEQPKPPKQKLKPLSKPQLAKAELQKSGKLQKPAKTTPKLSQYASLAQKYYLARRCNTMGQVAIRRLYGNVLANHKAAMASNPASSVKAMLRSVEARAGSQSCS